MFVLDLTKPCIDWGGDRGREIGAFELYPFGLDRVIHLVIRHDDLDFACRVLSGWCDVNAVDRTERPGEGGDQIQRFGGIGREVKDESLSVGRSDLTRHAFWILSIVIQELALLEIGRAACPNGCRRSGTLVSAVAAAAATAALRLRLRADTRGGNTLRHGERDVDCNLARIAVK